MCTVNCETSEECFYDLEQSFACEALDDSFHTANEELFLPYDVRLSDVRFQLIILSTNSLKFLFSPYYLSYLAGAQNIAKYAYTMIVVPARVFQKVDNSFSTDKSLSRG